MDEEARFRWQDRMLFGQTFTDWTEVDHPDLGPVLVGGGTKYSRRTPPPFMLEEESHRNFAFTMYHADQMPLLRLGDVVVEDLGGGHALAAVAAAKEEAVERGIDAINGRVQCSVA